MSTDYRADSALIYNAFPRSSCPSMNLTFCNYMLVIDFHSEECKLLGKFFLRDSVRHNADSLSASQDVKMIYRLFVYTPNSKFRGKSSRLKLPGTVARFLVRKN